MYCLPPYISKACYNKLIPKADIFETCINNKNLRNKYMCYFNEISYIRT